MPHHAALSGVFLVRMNSHTHCRRRRCRRIAGKLSHRYFASPLFAADIHINDNKKRARANTPTISHITHTMPAENNVVIIITTAHRLRSREPRLGQPRHWSRHHQQQQQIHALIAQTNYCTALKPIAIALFTLTLPTATWCRY